MAQQDSSSVRTAALGGPTWRPYLPVMVAAALCVVTMMLAVRGGVVTPDLRGQQGLSPAVADSIVFARYAGIVDILLRNLPVLLAVAVGAAGWGAGIQRMLAWPRGMQAGEADSSSNGSRQGIRPRILPGGGASGGVSGVLPGGVTMGVGGMWLLMYGLALAGQANGVAAWGLCVVGVVIGVTVHRRTLMLLLRAGKRTSPGSVPGILPGSFPVIHPPGWWCVLVGPAVGLLLVAACCPPGTLWSVEALGYDVLSYHLQIPREWLWAGRMTGLEHNVYGYLPSLVETGFLQLGAMRGSMYDAVYACQLMSVGLMTLAAMNLASLVRRWGGEVAGWVTAALFLATPWVLVTGSMAYNEAAVLAFGSAALALTLTPSQDDRPWQARWRQGVKVGVLLGLATLAKLTAGFMLALPVGLLWALRLAGGRSTSWRQTAGLTCVVALAGGLTLLPYLSRNTAWTGNPVFPFAASTLGKGHWDDTLVDRWQRGHHVEDTLGQRITALGQQWLCNLGYGAVGGRDRLRDPNAIEARNVAYFHRQWGVPTLLLAALAGGVVMMRQRTTRRLLAALAVVLLVQMAGWLWLTHLQSRFMIFSLLPVVVLVGLGMAEMLRHRREVAWLASIVAVALVATLTLTGVDLLRHQVAGGMPVWTAVDALPTLEQALAPPGSPQAVPTHPINRLPADSLTWLVADNSGLFYLHRPFVYHSAFDANPLGELIRRHHHDWAAVVRALCEQGVTHLWVHEPELRRLSLTYGFDPDVTPAAIGQLLGRPPLTPGEAGVFALPCRGDAGQR